MGEAIYHMKIEATRESATDEQRRQLMKVKYQFDGWEKKYRKVEMKDCESYDSLAAR